MAAKSEIHAKFERMIAPNLGRQVAYVLGAVVAYSLWKWYTLSNEWKNGSRSISDSDNSVGFAQYFL